MEGEGIAEARSAAMPVAPRRRPGLTCPWLGIYGETADGEPDPGISRLRDAANSSEVATNVVVYPHSGHRFDDDPDAAADAWQRTLNWFDSHLR